MNYEILNDAKLWELIASNDRNAFGHSFKIYSGDLFKYGQKFSGSKELIEDTIQDVYLDLWNRRKTTQIKNSLKFYLFTAFRREIIRRLGNLRKQDNTDQLIDGRLMESSYLEKLIIDQQHMESNDRLHEAIHMLTDRQKEAVYLRYFVALQYDEIAELMEIQVASLYNILFKSIKSLKGFLAQKVQYKRQ